jgi:hypothetical protein
MTKPLSSDSENIELMKIGDASSPLVVSINTFQGRRYFDIRRHYLDKATKLVKPGPKGISLKEDEFSAIAKYISTNIDSITLAFTSNLKSDEMAVRGDRREKIARELLKSSNKEVDFLFDSWPGPNFFHAESMPNKTSVTFNKRNQFIQKISEDKSESLAILCTLVAAFIQAKAGLEFGKKVNPESVIEFLEVHWGQGLR